MDGDHAVRTPAGLHEIQHAVTDSSIAQSVARKSNSNGVSKPTAVCGPTTVVIPVGATGSGRWTDEMGSVADTVDCAVHVALQRPSEVKQQAQPAKKTGRWWIKRSILAGVVVGCVLSAILVPYSLVIGLNTKLPRRFQLLAHPAPSHKIIFAFIGDVVYASPKSILPAQAEQVSQWTVLASSGVHVAAFSSREAKQQAMAALADAKDIKYAVADFQLLPDCRASSISNPMQLVDLSRLQPVTSPQHRRLQTHQQYLQGQQHQQAHDSGNIGNAQAVGMNCGSQSVCLKAAQVSRLVATHAQRLAERKARRQQLLLHQPSLATIGLPATAQSLKGWADVVQQERLLGTGDESHQQPSLGASTYRLSTAADASVNSYTDTVQQPAAAAARADTALCAAVGATPSQYSTSVSEGCQRAVAGWADITLQTAAGPAREEAAVAEQFSGAAAAAVGVSTGQLLAFQTQRRLQQYQPPPPPPQPQLQQRQALIHPQKGGQGVAWYLTDAGLHMREAWNSTYGMDDMLVAVIDSGLELSQGGIGASAWINSGEVAGDAVDNDANGFVDDVFGWDFGGSCADTECSYCIPGPDPTDSSGWGTHAASIIAAQPEVSTGTSGIAPGVRVMALKVSDCRGGSVLADAVAEQLHLGLHSEVADLAAAQAGPMLLASAAVQAMDYALLNGAHIVLAAWQAGGIIDSIASSNGTFINGGSANSSVPAPGGNGGAEQGAQHQGLNCVLSGTPAGTNITSNCLAAAQALLFRDVLRPLDKAGVLVVTMHPDENYSNSTPGSNSTQVTAAAVLPCSLGLELSNVLCVGSQRSVAASAEAVTSSVPAQSYFDNIIYTLTAETPGLGNSTDGNSTDSNSTSNDDDEVALPEYFSNKLDEPLLSPDQESNTITDVTGVVRTLLSENPVQLMAPGTNILSGWAWGSHAVVSGGSAAAAVAAGAAALAWSNLGQTLGAEATRAAAMESLGQLVKQMMLEASRLSSSTSKSARTSASMLMEQGASSTRSGGGTAGDLRLLEVLKLTSSYTGPLKLKAAHIGPAVTAVSNALSYSWHISSLDSGPFNTPAMSFVARKALKHEAPFPLKDWEFFGYTALVEVEGYVVVPTPGNYSLAVVSEDKFIMWLQGKWLRMGMVGDVGPSMGLTPGAWTATVLFSEPGYYQLRIIIYMPSLSSFDLLWQPPGASSYAHIPHFASFGRTQPVPLQLADQMTAHMLAHDSSSRSGLSSALTSRINSEHSNSSSSSPVATNSRDRSYYDSLVVTQPATTTSEAPSSPASTGSSANDVTQSAPDGRPVTSKSDGNVDFAHYNPAGSNAHYTQPETPDNGYVDASAAAAAAQTPAEHQLWSSSDGSSGWDRGYNAPGHGSSGWGGWGSGSSSWAGSFGNFFDSIFAGFGWSTEKGKRGATEMLPDEYDTTLHTSYQYDSSVAARHSDGLQYSSSSPSEDMLGNIGAVGGNSSRSTGISRAGTQHNSQDAMPQQQQQQQPVLHPSKLRSLLSTHWMNPVAEKQAVMPLPGVFSVAMTLEEPWTYRTIIPSLSNLNLRRTGCLPGSGLEVSDGAVLQQQLFGNVDALDDRSGYGVIQGWLSWKNLNPGALEWLQGLSSGGADGSMQPSPNTIKPSSESGEWGVMDTVQAGRAGVQFELMCGDAGVQQGCSLHVDGLVVAGTTGQPAYSTCIMPARQLFGSSSSSNVATAVSEQLLHLELLFATDLVRLTTLSVRSRACLLAEDGTVQIPNGSDGTFTVVKAAEGASALGVDSAAIASLGDADVSGGYKRGMTCTVRATVPAAAASRSTGSSSSGGDSKLEQVVHLTAEDMRQATASSYNMTAVEEHLTKEAASAAANAVADHSESSSAAGFPDDWLGTANSTDGNTTNSTEASSDYPEWMPDVDTHAEATSKAVMGVPGITIAQLAPQWVASLPADTTYSFTCGCYWNGSWEGNVAVGVHAGSSGTAAMYLAGWPVDAEHVLPQYGPSDIYTPDYSTLQQRQQLVSGSNAADPINWAGGSPGTGLGMSGLDVASNPGAAAKLGYRPKQLSDGRVFTLGQVNGVRNLVVSPGSGRHQLLVVQGEGLHAWGSVVVVADVPGVVDISSSNSSRPYAATRQGWLPGEWDAWVPR